MLSAAVAALSVVALAAALILAVMQAKRPAGIVLGVAAVLAVTAGTFAVIGARRNEGCVHLAAGENRYDVIVGGGTPCPEQTLGLYDPF